jgi:adenosylcobyric acid synthase
MRLIAGGRPSEQVGRTAAEVQRCPRPEPYAELVPQFDRHAGERGEGYEIHHGVVRIASVERAPEGEPFLDGWRAGTVRGTSWHGIFENDGFRRASCASSRPRPAGVWRSFPDSGADADADAVSFTAIRQTRLDAPGDLVADHLDIAALPRLIDGGPPPGLPFVPPGAL